MSDFDFSPQEKVLMALHNLCAVYKDSAKNPGELATSLDISIEETDRILGKYESEGYTRSYVDKQGNRRFYLTSAGIIRICSYFS